MQWHAAWSVFSSRNKVVKYSITPAVGFLGTQSLNLWGNFLVLIPVGVLSLTDEYALMSGCRFYRNCVGSEAKY